MTTGIEKIIPCDSTDNKQRCRFASKKKKKKKMGTKDPKDPTGTELVQEYFVSTYVCRGTPKIQ